MWAISLATMATLLLITLSGNPIAILCCIPKAADILEREPLVKFLEGHKNRKKHPRSNANNPSEQLQWNDAATLSFKASKEAIAKATLLKHPIPGAQLSLW
ncbi:transposon Ty3-I Gag-Pol polyprotein [Trichonephila clavipes]|uniref:Transposon Ty3-I Gag-Pol polyprotein n=1 Tax=Trichonephila clavipes TaxID=2585209 RepID=A0A8X6SCL7_TRICX|nr:transposon Ty3-I Gag-Pol polyprotein [Trichonephila clavipes]